MENSKSMNQTLGALRIFQLHQSLRAHLSFDFLEIGHAIRVRIHIVQLLRTRLGRCLGGRHKMRERLLFLVYCLRRGWCGAKASTVAELEQTLGTTRATSLGAERIAEKCARSVVDFLSKEG